MMAGIHSIIAPRRTTCRRAGMAPTSANGSSRDWRTLAIMPMPRGPRPFGSHWPAYAHDWADLLAQQEADQEQKQLDQREANRTRLRPSSVEIMRMEQAIVWPAHYLLEIPQLLRTVGACAFVKSRGQDLEAASRRLRYGLRTVRLWNNSGLDQIAKGLIQDRIRTW